MVTLAIRDIIAENHTTESADKTDVSAEATVSYGFFATIISEDGYLLACHAAQT